VAKSKVPAELRELGGNIRRLRMSAGMTQERLAELVDINPRNIRRIEAGEINLLITTMARIRQALNCRWDDLVPRHWKK
jgi:transcriptional regulator with XRE-family HTH domain